MPSLTGQVALVGGTDPRTDAISAALRAAGAEVVAAGDRPITSFADAEALVAEVVSAHGRLDILLTPIPPAQSDGLLALTEGPWRDFITTYLKRSVALARAASIHMATAGGGRIVTFSSSTTFLSTGVEQAAVNSSILSLTSAIALTMTDRNVLANCVVLGHPDTDQGGMPPVSTSGPDLLVPTVVQLCDPNGANISGRFVYCGGADIGLYTMPLIIENANVVISFGDQPDADTVGEFLAPLTNVGKD